jgi:hypothetical protein
MIDNKKRKVPFIIIKNILDKVSSCEDDSRNSI